jgi:amino-acid N-acetyltransferase
MPTVPISPHPPLAVVTKMLAAAQLPTSDLTDKHCENFFYAGRLPDPEGIVGLEIFDDIALLRSLVVRSESRGSGLGSELVSHVENHARSRGVHALYLLTTTAESFFESRGYRTAKRDQTPAAIKVTREFAGICPASSAFMNKLL